mgnify:CR=1 FL=1|tara:strand:+ start:1057 stop:1977 length:921 start_codon:yes stop_codon:yes gene_type:complete
MKLSIIGYKNHALRLKTILDEIGVESTLWNHHKDDINEIKDSDGIIISSPNDTHVDYIKKILSWKKTPYIFCEKPPAVNLKELIYLDGLDTKIKEKIFFNFNRRFSFIPKLIEEKNLGRPIHFNFISSHGLAFKSSDNWRFKSDNELMGVYGTVAIHYIDMCIWLLGECEDFKVHKSIFTHSKLADSVSVDMKFSNGCTTNIFVSYVTPFVNRSHLIFENGIIEKEGGKLSLFENWECYDRSGFFVKPERQIIHEYKSSREYYSESIKNSVNKFIKTIREKTYFNLNHFEKSIYSNKILLLGVTND